MCLVQLWNGIKKNSKIFCTNFYFANFLWKFFSEKKFFENKISKKYSKKYFSKKFAKKISKKIQKNYFSKQDLLKNIFRQKLFFETKFLILRKW